MGSLQGTCKGKYERNVVILGGRAGGGRGKGMGWNAAG